MKKNALIIVVALLYIACEKDSDDKVDENQHSIVFSGITSTNENNQLLSEPDTTDWNFDDEWVSIEDDLFELSFEKTCDSEDGEYISAYPNPCIDRVIIYSPSYVYEDKFTSIRVVDKEFNVLYSADSVKSGYPMLDIESLGLSNQMIRVYYKIYGEDCEWRGHGDIQVN